MIPALSWETWGSPGVTLILHQQGEIKHTAVLAQGKISQAFCIFGEKLVAMETMAGDHPECAGCSLWKLNELLHHWNTIQGKLSWILSVYRHIFHEWERFSHGRRCRHPALSRTCSLCLSHSLWHVTEHAEEIWACVIVARYLWIHNWVKH